MGDALSYWIRNNVINMTDELGHVTHHEYDLAGRETAVTMAYGTADAKRTTYNYYNDNRKFTETDANNRTATYFHDEAGRLIKARDALLNETQYQYDDAGNRVLMKDANQHQTQYQYDARKRLRKTIYDNQTFTSRPTMVRGT